MDGLTQNKIAKMVHKLRSLLEKEIAEILEGDYGLHKDGTIEDIENLPKIRENKKSLGAREGFIYFLQEEAISDIPPGEALKKLILNLTFTHLNRLFAIKLMERRNVIKETIGRLHKSNGFIHYIVHILGKKDFSEIENIDKAYEDFILYQCHKISEEIRVLFSEDDLSAFIFPRSRTLKEILEIINSSDLDELWDKDETIGWFYQYFTPDEIRKKARAESDVPRNSLELGFRNQFYTPRYVVQYLSDNTLGRMWYEMTEGKTELVGFCKYLVRPPDEVFLRRDELPDETRDIFQVPFREKKDPRTFKILDPACGSGHFLLYVFDLLKEIYKEAYEDEKSGDRLRKDYPDKKDFEIKIPGLILENNLYGIDIDMRAIQIAALALWLRAQREWNDMGIRREDRPKVRKIHFVCAEPMPGNRKEFERFVSDLKPALLGELLKDIWEKMKLAGEAGALLQIEKDLRNTIKRAKEEYKKLPQGQLSLWEDEAKQTEFDFSDITDEDFFREAEKNVLNSLRKYAREAVEQSYSRILFAEETARGFDFIEILRERFDVVLMNPPFGDSTPAVKNLFGKIYPEWNKNILCAFIHRMLDITSSDGFVGVIFDRTAIVKSSYEKFRKNILIDRNAIFSMADTGWEVLDANVETTTMVLHKNIASVQKHPGFFFDVRNVASDGKGERIFDQIKEFHKRITIEEVYISWPYEFEKLPNSVIGYDWPQFAIEIFNKFPNMLENNICKAWTGHQVKMDVYVRNTWEMKFKCVGLYNNGWSLYYNGGEYSLFYLSSFLLIKWHLDGKHLTLHSSNILRNTDLQYKLCIGYGKRGEYLDAQLVREKHFFSLEGLFFRAKENDLFYILAIINSKMISYLINLYCGQHKTVGYVNLLPIPIEPFIDLKNTLSLLSREGYDLKAIWYLGDETNYQFEKPLIITFLEKDNKNLTEILNDLITYEEKADREFEGISSEIDSKTLELYGVTDPDDIAIVEKAVEKRPKDVLWKETRGYSVEEKKRYHIESLLSFWLGCWFGRWDGVNGSFYDKNLVHNGEIYDLRETIKRKADELWEKDEIISEPTKFALSEEEINRCEKIKYPYEIISDGIIPLDKGHSKDLVRLIEIAAEITFGKENLEEVIKEIELILKQDIRSYFTKKFFDSHVNRYLKKPVYWLLQSCNRNYSIYLYYHSINRDTLFKIIRNYIEPRINLLSSELKELQGKIESSDGGEKRRFEDRKQNLEEVLQETIYFKEAVKNISSLAIDLNIDDGITVNISLFKDVILWKQVNDNWDELEKGSYDWSGLAMKLWPERVKGKCKKDKSLAVVHGLE